MTSFLDAVNNQRRVLILGINGFVGSNLALTELNSGNKVIGIVRDINDKTQKDILDRCTIILGDILDLDLLKRVLADYEIDLVYHLAASSIVKIANKNPESCYQNNIIGTLNVLEAVRQINPKIKLVIASSDKAYGSHDKLPYTEDMKLIPEDPYSTSKACADLISQSYFKSYNLDVNVIRCANIYGPRDMNLSRVIPNTITRIKKGLKPVIYSGVLNYKREFIYIDDVCKAYQILASKGKPGEIYNIGDNQFWTIKDIVNEICTLMHWTKGYEIVGKDFYDIPLQYLSAKKLKALGWEKKTLLGEGLLKTIEWY